MNAHCIIDGCGGLAVAPGNFCNKHYKLYIESPEVARITAMADTALADFKRRIECEELNHATPNIEVSNANGV